MICVNSKRLKFLSYLANISVTKATTTAISTNLKHGDERPVECVEVLAVARALFGHDLAARADVLVVDVTAELAAEQVHSKHAMPR